ncbi:hypothetical protein Fot_09129 [Forsythia ovata]|uniref:Uncharacterized protein n=1 Tax=Forsythia ovata TaxID=205694 RepID=A0ABD1WD61_9LAMI
MKNVSDSSLELDHKISYEGKFKSGMSKFDENCATPDEAKKNIILKKVATGGISRENSKEKSQLKLGGLDGSDSRLDVMKSLDKKKTIFNLSMVTKDCPKNFTLANAMGVGSHTQQQMFKLN